MDTTTTKAHVQEALNTAAALHEELELLGTTLAARDPLAGLHTAAAGSLRVLREALESMQDHVPETREVPAHPEPILIAAEGTPERGWYIDGLEPGDLVMVRASREGGRELSYTGTVRRVSPSGTVLIDDADLTDGAGTPILHYCSSGIITRLNITEGLAG